MTTSKTMAPRSVLVVGGGLAGLSTAAALATRGLRVTVLESRNRLGGRASSFHDAASGQVIDACQHVTMGCCTNFNHFCQTTGIEHLLERQATLYFMTPNRRMSQFGADPLPAPLHLARSLLRAHYLTLADKVRVGWGMLSLALADPSDDQPLLPWLRQHRQNQRTIDRFWGVVLVSALNESMDRLGLKYARKVFCDGFLRHPNGFEVSIPKVPLSRFYGDEMRSWFDKQGIAIELNAGATQFGVGDGRISGITLRGGRELHADWYVSSVPFDRLIDLLPNEVVDRYDDFKKLRRLEVSPITSIHLWFDRPITNLPHIVLVDCLGHWLFNRGQIATGEHYVQVVVSASRSLRDWGHDEIQRRIVEELGRLCPAVGAATLVRGRVVTERRATFSTVAGVDQWRPKQKSPLPNLILAGDWTETGWPATMEGAVRSGYLAAEAICVASGRPERILQPDLR